MLKRLVILTVIAVLATMTCAYAGPVTGKSQAVYVPAYSNVFSGDRALPFKLAVTLLVRNTDPKNSITVTSIVYYDENGKALQNMISAPIRLKPLATASFFIKESDISGGIGANFVVRWQADREVNVPIIETVMIGARGGQGISFIGASREIKE